MFKIFIVNNADYFSIIWCIFNNIFRFFTQSDIDVAGGYIDNYLPNFPQPEVRMMLSGFAAREALHIAAYSHLIESLGMPDSTYNEFLEYDAMREKHEYFMANVNSKKISLPIKIAAISAFTEGLALFSSFIMLLNFPRHGKMKGMGQIVTWSIVDETQHAEGMIQLFRNYIEENREEWNDETKSAIYSIAETMVDLEDTLHTHRDKPTVCNVPDVFLHLSISKTFYLTHFKW